MAGIEALQASIDQARERAKQLQELAIKAPAEKASALLGELAGSSLGIFHLIGAMKGSTSVHDAIERLTSGKPSDKAEPEPEPDQPEPDQAEPLQAPQEQDVFEMRQPEDFLTEDEGDALDAQNPPDFGRLVEPPEAEFEDNLPGGLPNDLLSDLNAPAEDAPGLLERAAGVVRGVVSRVSGAASDAADAVASTAAEVGEGVGVAASEAVGAGLDATGVGAIVGIPLAIGAAIASGIADSLPDHREPPPKIIASYMPNPVE